MFFTVKDSKGNLVPHLNQQNCTVEENKEPQTLKTFVAETNQPLTLGILLDTSGSQQRLLAHGSGRSQPVHPAGSALQG